MPGTPGAVRTDPDGTRTLVLDRRLPDAVDAVWAEITEPARLARWYGTYTGTGGTGGTVELTITAEVDAGGEVDPPVTVDVLACEAPHRLVVDVPADSPAAWRLAVGLSGDGDGTALRFEHRLTDGLDGADVESGWQWYLDRLAASLHDEAMPDWDEYSGQA